MSRKVALITGGASGIGRGCAERLAKDGYAVAIADLQSDLAQSLASSIAISGGEALALETDVTNSAALDAAVSQCVDRLGSIDVLVASAGMAVLAPIVEMTDAAWKQVLDVDLTGVFYAFRAAARQMIKQGRGGVLLGVSSAYAGIPGFAQAAYCAAKSGVVRLVECGAMELGQHGIRVNAIAPGVIRTPMTSVQDTVPALNAETLRVLTLKRLGEPRDIASTVAFLSSDEASYITGQTLYVDGGFTLKGGIDLEVVFKGETVRLSSADS